MNKIVVFTLLLSLSLFAETKIREYKVLREIPHRSDAFTQGLLFQDGYLWESTGSPGGGTKINKIDVNSGEIVNTTSGTVPYFGEGLAFDGVMLYQLSWKQELVHIFSYPQLTAVATLPYKGEGWGLTHNGESFFMSSGSDSIVERNQKFQEVNRFGVTLDGVPLKKINELEWDSNSLWANVWYSDSIVEMNPQNGVVKSVVDLSPLRRKSQANQSSQVVNGIAALGNNQFWVTGKFWNTLYLIEIGE